MKWQKVSVWVLVVILALAFAGAGMAKLLSAPMMVAEFALFGYPQWFLYVVGSLEVLSAIFFLLPRLRAVATAVVVCIMVGAIFSHVTHGQFGMAIGPLVLLVLAIALGSLQGWWRGGRLSTSS
jgi:putative oxidoreductase